jgi:hypothetical protein
MSELQGFIANITRSWRTTLAGIVIAVAALFMAYNEKIDGATLTGLLVLAVFLLFGKDPKRVKS